MLPLPHSSKRTAIALGLCVNLAAVSLVLWAEDVSAIEGPLLQVGRYSVMMPGPALGQRDLMSAISSISIPADVTTVGGAMAWVLNETGYRLVARERLSPDVVALLQLPLPKTHRHFQSLPLREVLGLLAGPGFILVQDPVHRLVSFERCRGLPMPNDNKPVQAR